MKVLYVDHTSLVSGAQHALLDLLRGLPPTVEPIVACPEGPLASMVTDIGVCVAAFSGTSGSLRLHPYRTVVAAGEIARSGLVLRRLARAAGADVIHANSIRAGLMTSVARRLGGPPMVVHVHDALPPSRASNLVRRTIHSSADALITISGYTTRSFVPDGSLHGVHMLHNPLDVARFDPAAMSRIEARRALGLGDEEKLVGLLAQITPWKGQDTAIHALKLVHRRHPDARLLLVGETKFVSKAARYDNVSYERWLYRLVRGLGLEERVEFWGERGDVTTVVRALDVLLAPSWEEPFGRSVIEAMALETAVIATDVGGPAEYITHGVDGLVLPPRDATRWAVALERLLSYPLLRHEIARRGSITARAAFSRSNYVSNVLQVYHEVIDRPGRLGGPLQRVDRAGDLGEAVSP